jgi:tRNA 2-thiouridine synthesizing protein A
MIQQPPTPDGVDQPSAAPAHADEEWNAGDLGCGELVLELRMRMARLEPGRVLKLIARDPGAPADLPAWCGMTGHTLVSDRHPIYLIRRKP